MKTYINISKSVDKQQALSRGLQERTNVEPPLLAFCHNIITQKATLLCERTTEHKQSCCTHEVEDVKSFFFSPSSSS